MEAYVGNQIRYALRYLPGSLLKSYFIRNSSDETRALRRGGFMRGVTHPKDHYADLKDAEINWVRFVVPYPFDENGDLREDYLFFKRRAAEYRKHGIRVMAITPIPGEFIRRGADPRTPDGQEKVKETAVFYAKDLQDVVGAFQIANEMGLPRFTMPLTTEEAARFLGIQMEAMAPYKGNILIGYNSAGPEAQLHVAMRRYARYFDYVGIDIYLGCFYTYPGLMGLFDVMLRYLWGLLKKPVILQEFGYIGGGRPKSKAEKQEILRGYGVSSEAEALTIMEAFTERLPREMNRALKHDSGSDPAKYYDLLFNGDLKQHFYMEMPASAKIPGYDHTPEGQAKFFDDLLPRLYKLPFVAGCFVFSYFDAPYCYVCGQKDCPVETKWGLVANDGTPKPAYYAVRRQYGRIRFLDQAGKMG